MTDQPVPGATAPTRGRLGFILLPAAAFLGFGVFWWSLTHGGGGQEVPSALIGKAAPEFSLPPLPGLDLPGLTSTSFKGKVTLVNVWASWCAPCRVEHPVLMDLAKDASIQLVGLNYRDNPDNARRYLGGLGNPFAAVGYDQNGRVGIDWGVYGQPETFVVSPKGVVTYKYIGPITADSLKSRLRPEIEKARGL